MNNISPFVPTYSHPTPEIWREESDVGTQQKQHEFERREIFLWLAGKKTEGSLDPEPPRTDQPIFNETGCFDKTIFGIFCTVIKNPLRLTKDALFGCFTPCVMTTPKRNTYVTKETWTEMTKAQVYVNRNTCILCCVTPGVLSTLPFTGFVPLATRKLLWLTSVAGCCGNVDSLFSAGCLTYFWSGRYGGAEQNAYDEMMFIFNDQADFLQEQWKKFVSGTEEEKEFLEICELLRKNSLNIKNGMINAGLTPESVKRITHRLYKTVAEILQGTHYRSIHVPGLLLEIVNKV